MPNLKEQIEAYANYLITASVTAILAVGGTLGVQAIKHHFNPGPLTVNAVTDDMLDAAQGRLARELQEKLRGLRDRADELTQARDNAQNAVTTAGDTATDEQTAALTRAQNALDEHNAQITALEARISNGRAVNDVIANAGQRAILVNIINRLAPAAPTTTVEGEGNSQ